MRIILQLSSFVLIGTFLCGCSCERNSGSDRAVEDLSQPPPPLSVQAVPHQLKVDVAPQVGATSSRPIAIVVAKDPSVCATIKQEWRTSGHVLCTDQGFEQAEPLLKRAIAYLKKTYPRHTGQPPVHLFADAARSDVGWRLMLKEPGFFAYGYLPGIEEKVLTNTTLAALHSQGARALVLGLEDSKRLELLKNVASRRGLQVYPRGIRSTPGEASALMKQRDTRLATPQQASPKSKQNLP
jgi:hypothetical protein